MTLNYLTGVLEEANTDVNKSGEIVLQPIANSVDTMQQMKTYLAGYQTLDGSGKLNRNWHDLKVTVAKHLDKQGWQ